MDTAKEWPVAEGSERKRPTLTSLTTLTVKGDFRAYAQMKALKWAMNADVFILALDIDDLKNRPKNTEELKSIAARRIAAMENEPDDATSAVIKDRNGVTLACVFARKSANVTKIHGGRTLAQFSGLSRNEEKYDLFICFPICAEISRHPRSFSLVADFDCPLLYTWWRVQGIPNCFDRALRHKGIDVKFTESKVRTKVSIGQSHDPPLELDLVGMATVASYTRTSSCAKIINILNRGQAGDCRSNVASMGNTAGGQLILGGICSWNLPGCNLRPGVERCGHNGSDAATRRDVTEPN
ncbi:hypothetical protein B0H13DRAFT_1856063 [Mycena leptocephala]|nr:hypothetical protein B0H13DRAFT_1856063 [Mycena leptocephala]